MFKEKRICPVCKESFIEYKSSGKFLCSLICKHKWRSRPLTHGDSYSHLYRVWCDMKIRCKPSFKGPTRKYYYDRGIRLCREWMNYESFKDWAINNGYNRQKSIDRINGDKGYFPKNCRWVTRHHQQINKRKRNVKNRTSKYKGVSKCPNGKYRSGITINGLFRHIGVFASEKDAAKAYDKEATQVWGEFACLNFQK